MLPTGLRLAASQPPRPGLHSAAEDLDKTELGFDAAAMLRKAVHSTLARCASTSFLAALIMVTATLINTQVHAAVVLMI